MALVLPSTVEELNFLQNSIDYSTVPTFVKESDKGFDNIAVERRFKREVSLPNGLQNWNIGNFDPYLNFDDHNQANNLEVIPESQDDRLVPEEGELRQRCESFSSVSSSMDDKNLVYHNIGVKTFNTVCVDSGSTCISSDHTYPAQTIFKGLDAEETYQNLDTFLKQVPEGHISDPIPIPSVSPVGSPMTDSNLEYSILSSFSSCSQDSFSEKPVGIKRPTSDLSVDDELFTLTTGRKRTCESPSGSSYYDNRKKNNIASKNCRKTRKEKQKEMEVRVTELEKEKEDLNTEVQLLEELIHAHKLKLYAILQSRR